MNKKMESGEGGLFAHSLANLQQVQRRMGARDLVLLPAAARLHGEADAALGAEPFSIVHKTKVPPSGDRHDYMSLGPYWWPDPATSDGLPYIRRDGEVHPDSACDRTELEAMTRAVCTLALAGFLFEREAYSGKAAELLQIFFLDGRTRMNPNLQFGQGIPGRCDGRGIGIIETTWLALDLIDAIGLLEAGAALSAPDRAGLRAWFGQYLDWLLESPHGRDEAGEHNNHGTAYDLQVAVFALFVKREELAREVIKNVAACRIAPQVEPDGRQPHELARTRALGYSTWNLAIFFGLADAAGRLGLDLWHVTTADGRGIRGALDWLVPYWTGVKPWTYPQIIPFDHERALELLRKAAWAYRDPRYETAAANLPLPEPARLASRATLYYPPVAR